MKEMRSLNSSNFSNGVSGKMNSKINNIFEKKTIGTANMRQRPSQQGAINQLFTNQSSLQSPIPFYSVDSIQNTQNSQNRNGNQSNHINRKNNAISTNLSYMIKPEYLNQSSQQNNRITNNSCINIPCSSPMNLINPNHSSTNLFDTSQIQNHNKQQSTENGNNGTTSNYQQNTLTYLNNSQNNIQQNSSQNTYNNFQNSVQFNNLSNSNQQYNNYLNGKKQQVNGLHVKSNYLKHPNTPQMRGSGNQQGLINQEKRLSEQFHTESNNKIIKFTTQQQSEEFNVKKEQSSQLNLIQALTQNSNTIANKSSTRVIQKIRYNNSMSMIRMRSSQDSFFDSILGSDNQSKSMVQTKKKKKSKKLRTGSPTCSESMTVATQSQLISSTNRMNSIPSPYHSPFSAQTLSNPLNNHILKNSQFMNSNKTDQQKTQTSTLQNEFSSLFFSKLKKKKMPFFQSNAKGFPSKIETQQDMQKQQLQHMHSSYDSSPNYHVWLQQNQQQNQFQSQILSPTLKQIYSTFAQAYTPSSQYRNSQQQFSDNNTSNTSTLKLNSCSSKTHSLLDKLNKLHKYSQKNQNQLTDIQLQDKISQNIIQTEANEEIPFNKEELNNVDIDFFIQNENQCNNFSTENNQFNQSQKDEQIQYLQKFEELLAEQNCKNTSKQNSPLLFPQVSSEQASEKFLTDQVPELEEQISCQFFNKYQKDQSFHDIPLPSQTLKNHQYQQYENILLGFQKSCYQSKDIQMQQFLDYLITFAKKYIKHIPQIVRNSQNISSQYKKKDEECNKLKQERLNLLIERNKLQDKEYSQSSQNQQQQQEQTLKELHTPSTQIDDNSYQGLIAEQQMQISILKRQLEEKNTELQHMNQAYFEHIQEQENPLAQVAFNLKPQEDEDEICKLEIQNQIENANLELEQRYNQSLSIKSKSTSNLNENIRQKLKLDFSALKGNLNNSNTNNTKVLGLTLNNNSSSQTTEQQQVNQNIDQSPNQQLDYYDEFMSKIDEFSLSWRKAVIDESQKYQNRDNPLKKQQLMNEYKQQNNQ